MSIIVKQLKSIVNKLKIFFVLRLGLFIFLSKELT